VANIHAKHRGLAIQSTIGRLQNALAPENNYKQFIGEIILITKEYILLTICFSRFYSREKLSIRA
jgi:hypothetical protein